MQDREYSTRSKSQRRMSRSLRDVGNGLLVYFCVSCPACSLPSLSVVFDIAISTFLDSFIYSIMT